MEWVKFFENANINDKPRELSDKEIEYIVSHYPLPFAADIDSATTARNNIVAWIANSIRGKEMCPSAIPELIKIILDKHQKSLITPGTSIGITAAESIGATLTQMTLNSFHSSGSADSATFGIDSMTDIIFARKTPKNETCTIYFKDKQLTFEDVLNLRSEIVDTSIAYFMKIENKSIKYDIKEPSLLKQYWWNDTRKITGKDPLDTDNVLRLYFDIVKMFKHKVSLENIVSVLRLGDKSKYYTVVHGPTSDAIIDIYPDKNNLTAPLKDIDIESRFGMVTQAFLENVIVPELHKIQVKGITGITNLIPKVSPTWRIIFHERKAKLRDLPKTGYDLIRQRLDDVWLLFLNQPIIDSTGITAENISFICDQINIEVLGINNMWIAVALPNDAYTVFSNENVIKHNGMFYKELKEVIQNYNLIYYYIPSDHIKDDNGIVSEEYMPKKYKIIPQDELIRKDGKYYRQSSNIINLNNKFYLMIDKDTVVIEIKPGDYVSSKVNKEKTIYDDKLKRLTQKKINDANLEQNKILKQRILNKPVYLKRSDLLIASEFIIADAPGGNFRDLFMLPFIDKLRTTCNNMHTINNVLGIEATRNNIVRSLVNIISNTGSYVHPSNISFIAEFICSRGEPYGATYTGISMQPAGHLSLATVESAGKVFIQNALRGKKEDIRNVSASIILGSRMKIGNGYFDIAQDIVENGVAKTLVNDDVFRVAERDDRIKNQSDNIARTVFMDDETNVTDILDNAPIIQTIDQLANEDETDQIALYTGNNILHDLTVEQQEALVNKQKIERVSDIKSIFDNIMKTARPIDIEQFVKLPEQSVNEPFVSTGLLTGDEYSIFDSFPTVSYNDLYGEYDIFMGNKPRELPSKPIYKLPDLTGELLQSAQIELRQQYIQDMKPIDIEAFRAITK